METFLHGLSEQYRTEHFFGAKRSVLTEHLDPMFPRALSYIGCYFYLAKPLITIVSNRTEN